MDLKEQIKRHVSITDVVSLYVDLKPAGKYLKALCPFHTEKTPSFFVMPEKDSFSCYGCNKFGDIFAFVQEVENLSFPDAMNFLIDRFNIPIEKKKSSGVFKKDIYVKINETAMKYFKDNLVNGTGSEAKNALNYLDQRGIHRKTLELFSLGYAENKWDGLYNYLKNNSCDIEKAVELGLLIKNNANRIYDRFRGRIIFPILSESGTPIAFGGRTIFDEPNKYLNSPDTPLYKKSKYLYGFNLTKKFIREKKYSILVEGYFDVISLYQGGVKNVAASLGTALTENQIYLLKRFSDKIYIFYDSDKAGVAAAVRGIEKMFEQNINPGIITFADSGVDADAKDPDDFIRKKGQEAFNRLVETSTDGFKFLLEKISQKYDTKVPERKNDAIQSIMNFVGKFSEPIIRDEYIRLAADFFKVDEKKLEVKGKSSPLTAGPVSGKELAVTPAERIFLESILAIPELIDEVKGLFNDDMLSVLASGNIIRLLLKNYNREAKAIDDYNKISKELSNAERVLFQDIFDNNKNVKKEKALMEKQVEFSFLKFQDILNKRDARRIDQEIKLAEQQDNFELVRRLLEEKNRYITSKYKQKHRHISYNHIGGAIGKS